MRVVQWKWPSQECSCSSLAVQHEWVFSEEDEMGLYALLDSHIQFYLRHFCQSTIRAMSSVVPFTLKYRSVVNIIFISIQSDKPSDCLIPAVRKACVHLREISPFQKLWIMMQCGENLNHIQGLGIFPASAVLETMSHSGDSLLVHSTGCRARQICT